MLAADILALAQVCAKLVATLSALGLLGLSLYAALGLAAPTQNTKTRLLFAAGLLLSLALGFWLTASMLAGSFAGAIAMASLVADVQGLSLSAGVLGALLCLGVRGYPRVRLALGALGLALSFGLTGHAQSASLPSIASLLVALHVLIAGFWFAAPMLLWPSPALSNAELQARHTRFSTLALPGIPLLFVLGGVLALYFGGGPNTLLESRYGAVLGLKTLLALAALALGVWNRWRIAPKLGHAPVAARKWLRWQLGLDSLLFAAIALLVSLATTRFAP
jgi:copper resistance protein D